MRPPGYGKTFTLSFLSVAGDKPPLRSDALIHVESVDALFSRLPWYLACTKLHE